ncbi:7-cyano-7-deazaguanine tRNA-ribosyltransferase [Methanosarcina sp. 2.H.T.1A.6]|uniref:tRNA guanosine(15) transglycosylase TgtA n=1 Tax=unclassified Methanosarcina TaxID=2644672 RepID=UPI0006210BD2|nr:MULTISPECIES: tRNA guanosine(15) transglycosylase TgtA [unclassified Methanosarcina]KKG17994.1 7-cyano-7-deazaguanine tRNA-ribosyltransferase [Methanosarcina sp. 2.H.T.1A.3]KKG19944.1 7-cyano-7-deazaguanine tRNA-ribosyltransferase [Methanosarcina sp. 2.H.T.1A.6]KKG22608.1 7-cyano-7-deazaguanine tRNA-ribosyltransferase [Methanosarcina sp. 2.H.T.1A.8]KKG23688.1 7-cyano-7-deazaguanine tRNA-ribosyltransferase [Methanosarcina sp. 2.H.T.1A.15]
MSATFEILDKDAGGRIGKLKTPHGTVETPTVMPVVNPNIQLISPKEMKSFGAEILITNSYIIYRKEELRSAALEKGLHGLLGFDGPIMTDSGSFQLSVYGSVEVTNEEILAFQQKIGSDIIVPLDIPTPPDVHYRRAEEELVITTERLEAARKFIQGEQLLAGPVQGSTYPELREKAASHLKDLNFDVYPLGAVVPLMESYRYAELADVIAAAKKGLSPTSPVHLFGAGHPMMFALAVALGCDLFDSAAYALYAKDGRYITVNGTYHIEKLNYLPCSCPICSKYTADELRKAKNRDELLGRHNLYATFAEIRLIKQCIKDGKLLELVEQRCRAHPKLLDGLKKLYTHSPWLEQLDPATKGTYFYCGPESASRPEVLRFGKRLERFSLEGSAIIRTTPVKGERSYDQLLIFKAPFGAFPAEMEEVYPFNAEVSKFPDYEALSTALSNTLKLIELNPKAKFTFVCEREFEHPLLEKIKEKAELVYRDAWKKE